MSAYHTGLVAGWISGPFFVYMLRAIWRYGR